MGEEGLRVEGLTIEYNGVPAVLDASLELEAPFFAVILGPNGAGKTTLLRGILGLARPSRGRVRVMGLDPFNRRDSGRLRRLAALVPQISRINTDVPLRAWEVVAMPLYFKGRPPRIPGRDLRSRALEYLELLGVGDTADKLFPELSGGQRQLVLIARALASGARLLILDEPLSMVDPARKPAVVDLLWRLYRERGVSVLMTTHDVTPVLREPMASEAMGILMYRRIHAVAPLARVLEDREALRRTFGAYTGLGDLVHSLAGGEA